MTALDLHYQLARIDACLSDKTVSNTDFRNWMGETLLDMQEICAKDHPITDEQMTLIKQAAAAQQAYIFHDASDDPMDNPAYTALFLNPYLHSVDAKSLFYVVERAVP